MRRKILVIDDQKDIRDVYLQILTKQKNTQTNALDLLENELFSDEKEDETTSEESTPQEEYYVDCASQGIEGVELVKKSLEEKNPYMVAFIDMRMPPGIDGKETAKRIREIDQDIEIVIVTAFSDHLCSEIIEYIGGPSKLLFLKKPFDVEEIKQLALNLTEKWILNKQNQEYVENLEKLVIERTKEIVEKNKTLERLSTIDLLTELNNTQKFYEELEKELERVKRLQRNGSIPKNLVLVAIDVDNLKYYNELFGHWNGDMILKTISQILKLSFRKTDTVARIGGDEFMAILPQTSLQEATEICNKLLNLIMGKFSFKDMVYLLDERRIEEIKQISGLKENDIIDVSITGALVEYKNESYPEKLVSKAMDYLKIAKSKGKNFFYIAKD